MTDLLRLLDDADHVLEDRLAIADKKPTCKVACAACCHHLVPATLPETILALVKAVGAGHQKLVTRVEKIRKDARRARRAGGDNDEWRKLKRPCLFLTAQKRCAAYEARPVACRTYVSLGAPERCYSKSGVVEVSDAPAVALEGLSEGLEKVAAELEVPGERRTLQEWLPTAAAWLASHPIQSGKSA